MKRLFTTLFLLLYSIPIFANLSAVNFSNLPQDSKFQDNLLVFLNNSKYMNHFTPEWNYPISKNELITITVNFEKELMEQTPRTYDLEILQLITMRYLYNLDAENYAKKIEDKVLKLKKTYSSEYRTYWIYGNYLTSSSQVIKGMNEFLYVIKKIKELKLLHPAFLEDYSYSCLLSFMFKNGLMALETASELRKKNISDYWTYKQLANMLQQPDINGNYPDNETWNLQKKENKFKLFSHMFGTSISVEENWDLKFTGLNNKQSFVMISPQKFVSSKGKEIGISVLFQYLVSDLSYADFVKNTKEKFSILTSEQRTINGINFNVYLFEDKSKYSSMGGSKGYYLTAEIPATKYSNCSIEFPYEINHENIETGNVSYYALKNGYDRINDTIYVGILLDSCNEVFTESSNFFWELINQTIFE